MNERIQKLAEQAGIYKLDLSDETEYWIIEKFAELIVRECASIVEAQKECLCDDNDYWSEHDYGYEMAVNDSVDMIKQHFGVEE